MKMQPNRPIRVGTKLMMSDDKGNIPDGKAGPDLDGMTKAELVKLAEKQGVSFSTAETKADILGKLKG